ncbi:MAG: metallophosphoesterase family protein [Terriglobia bacterium]
MKNPIVTPRKRRSAKHYAKLRHSSPMRRLALTSHFHRKVAQLSQVSSYPVLAAFLPQNLWPWTWNYLKFVCTRKFPFPSYGHASDQGVYSISPSTPDSPIKIAIAGDWGTGTDEAYVIARHMSPEDRRLKPDFTIHLGDVYYVGDEAEIEENCLGRSSGSYLGVTWPLGTQGSFSLNGNHEMYANGKAYFTKFLPVLGVRGSQRGQLTSYFSLETDSWRILGIDTGYNSVGLPILSQIPGINEIPGVGGNCRLEDATIQWLREVVKPKENIKATLLLSHHEYFSSFGEQAYTKPARQLHEFFPTQEVVWLWGHEHRMAIYDKYRLDGGITAYGRCLGHGGMPIEVGHPPHRTKLPLQWYDLRSHNLPDGSLVGQNGFLNLTLDRSVLRLDYRDIENESLLVEEFTAKEGGRLQHHVVYISKPGLTPWLSK